MWANKESSSVIAINESDRQLYCIYATKWLNIILKFVCSKDMKNKFQTFLNLILINVNNHVVRIDLINLIMGSNPFIFGNELYSHKSKCNFFLFLKQVQINRYKFKYGFKSLSLFPFKTWPDMWAQDSSHK